ncbi:hypothetical protein RN001_008480 [Aquatica leii]|uniref:Argonaute 2 n=1 Tax=Aquatica leii TaxID=1421715 RepID=A0AAN7SHA1_9COLE|nr:hypothetical protein RN001_008480 [Aquatica leii]
MGRKKYAKSAEGTQPRDQSENPPIQQVPAASTSIQQGPVHHEASQSSRGRGQGRSARSQEPNSKIEPNQLSRGKGRGFPSLSPQQTQSLPQIPPQQQYLSLHQQRPQPPQSFISQQQFPSLHQQQLQPPQSFIPQQQFPSLHQQRPQPPQALPPQQQFPLLHQQRPQPPQALPPQQQFPSLHQQRPQPPQALPSQQQFPPPQATPQQPPPQLRQPAGSTSSSVASTPPEVLQSHQEVTQTQAAPKQGGNKRRGQNKEPHVKKRPEQTSAASQEKPPEKSEPSAKPQVESSAQPPQAFIPQQQFPSLHQQRPQPPQALPPQQQFPPLHQQPPQQFPPPQATPQQPPPQLRQPAGSTSSSVASTPPEVLQSHQEVTQTQAAPKQGGNKRRGQKKEPHVKKTPEQTSAAPQEKPPVKSEPSAKTQGESSALDFIVPQRQKLSSGGTKGRKILIETNHLALQFKKLGIAYHYDVSIDPDKPKKLFRPAMEHFRRKFYPNRFPAFDGVKNLYSSSLLPFGEEISEEVIVREDDRDKTFKIKIKIAAEVDLTVLSKYFEAAGRGNIHMVTPQEAIQCIDVVLRNAPSLRCIPVGRSFFTKPRDRLMNLGEGMEMYYGFYQSAILGWKPFLNVDVSHKAFPKEIHVLDAIQEVCDRYYQLTAPLERENFEVVNKFLRNLKVIYEIPGQPSSRRIMRINELDRPAAQARFKNENNIEMTVADYFQRIKNVKLKFAHLPCLWVGSKQRDPRILLPPEFCTIVEGQVTNRTMTAGQTSAMIKIAATSTTDRKHKIMNGIKTANFAKDECAREFDISVNEKFAQIQARVLDPPKLKYANNQVMPRKGVWRAEKFDSSERLSNWCIFSADDRTTPQTMQDFAFNLAKEGRILGMNIDDPHICPRTRLMRGKERAILEEEFRKLKKNNINFVVVVIPDFIKEMYNHVKQAAELTVGIVTQCVKAKNVFQKKQSTLGNIILKINAKLNGRNHRLANVPLCLQRPCVIMGADVTHPSPESRGSVPSVAAVTASHDPCAFQYNITWRLQPSTQEIITDLTNIVREHLLFFYKKNRVKPERIIFFRDGVSEGQFEIVVQSEVQAIRNACMMLETTGNYKPKLTFLVVQKRHHTRFFPTNERDSEDRNFNVPAGTIVDTEITHPTALDFYLVSHASIQGVARPTKYRKLWDDDDMQEDELEELTYHLCHLFTRCTRSVSYPAPTYYAHLAAARAKVYCERRAINMNNLSREQAQLQIKEEVIKDFPMFFV